MTDRENFGNKCPYTDKYCRKDFDCKNCEVEEQERQFMEDLEKELMEGENE